MKVHELSGEWYILYIFFSSGVLWSRKVVRISSEKVKSVQFKFVVQIIFTFELQEYNK